MVEAISPRQAVAQELTDICVFGGLNEVYGVNLSKQKDQKGRAFWGATFCKAAVLDGYIRVYSPNFIIISWQTRYRDLPSTGSEVFRSPELAKDFIRRNFVRV